MGGRGHTKDPRLREFTIITSSTYHQGIQPRTEDECEPCKCTIDPVNGKKCGQGVKCLNRVMLVECSPECGENCLNQRIRRQEWVQGLQRFWANDGKGYGVKSNQEISKGQFILEYVGQVVTNAIFKERMKTVYAKDSHHYCLNLDGNFVIDSQRIGNEGRFVNHSCDPNCEMQKWIVSGIPRIGLFALRNIPANEELTYEYNFSVFNKSTKGQPCHCGSKNCRKVLGKKATKVPGKLNQTEDYRLGFLMMKECPPSTVISSLPSMSRREKLVSSREQILLLRNYRTCFKKPLLLHHEEQGEDTKDRPQFQIQNQKPFANSIIRCICGTYNQDEGLIECEQCHVWQHNQCMFKIDESTKQAETVKPMPLADQFKTLFDALNSRSPYLCEQCQPREYLPDDIQISNVSKDGKQFFKKVERKDGFIIRKGDHVYVKRFNPKICLVEYDVFRVDTILKEKSETLWIIGTRYLIPVQSFYTRSRKFFYNELLLQQPSPEYETFSADNIAGKCWVMDSAAFKLGRPIECENEEHVYICDFQVDKYARVFTRLPSPNMPSSNFQRFVTEMKVFQKIPRISTIWFYQDQKRRNAEKCVEWVVERMKSRNMTV